MSRILQLSKYNTFRALKLATDAGIVAIVLLASINDSSVLISVTAVGNAVILLNERSSSLRFFKFDIDAGTLAIKLLDIVMDSNAGQLKSGEMSLNRLLASEMRFSFLRFDISAGILPIAFWSANI